MKLKNTLWIFLILTPLSVLMRVYELLVMIDPETGFPRPEFMQADKTLLALFFLLFIAKSVKQIKKNTNDNDCNKENYPTVYMLHLKFLLRDIFIHIV